MVEENLSLKKKTASQPRWNIGQHNSTESKPTLVYSKKVLGLGQCLLHFVPELVRVFSGFSGYPHHQNCVHIGKILPSVPLTTAVSYWWSWTLGTLTVLPRFTSDSLLSLVVSKLTFMPFFTLFVCLAGTIDSH